MCNGRRPQPLHGGAGTGSSNGRNLGRSATLRCADGATASGQSHDWTGLQPIARPPIARFQGPSDLDWRWIEAFVQSRASPSATRAWTDSARSALGQACFLQTPQSHLPGPDPRSFRSSRRRTRSSSTHQVLPHGQVEQVCLTSSPSYGPAAAVLPSPSTARALRSCDRAHGSPVASLRRRFRARATARRRLLSSGADPPCAD